MRFTGFAAMLKHLRVLGGAALVLAAAVGPAAAEPEFLWTDTLRLNTDSGGIYIPVKGAFSDFGTNPVYNSVTFSTTAYINSSKTGFGPSHYSIDPNAETGELLAVVILSDQELVAMQPQPDNPFTFTADVTMTNDEGETASGTFTFEVTWSPYRAPPLPAFKGLGTITAAPGEMLTYEVADLFDNEGTDPTFSGAVFSTTEYYNTHSVEGYRLLVQPKTATELQAMTPLPSTLSRSMSL